MMLDLQRLEAAADVIMNSPYTTTTEQRTAAEDIFLTLRKTQSPYNLCKHILETSKNSYVQFEAGITLKSAVLREWSFLQHSATDELSLYLLMFLSHHTNVEKYVKEQLYQVIAVIMKRGMCRRDQSKESRSKLFEIIGNLISSHDKVSRMLSCGLLRAVLEEFALTSQASRLGMRFEDHHKCKMVLEEEHLHNIFVWNLQVLQPFVNRPLASDDHSTLSFYLGLADQIFHWKFASTNRYSLVWLKNDSTCTANFKPPKSWRETVISSGLCDFFFKLQVHISADEDLSHLCMQCLLQLASLCGPVVPDTSSKTEYFKSFCSGFFVVANRDKWQGHEALCAASIVSQMVNVCPTHVFVNSTKLLESFLGVASHLAITFLRLSVDKQNDEDDNCHFREASSTLLDSLVVLMSHSAEYPKGVFSHVAQSLFDCYLKCHLSAPDGYMHISATGEVEIEEIDCDVEEIDRVAFVDELNNAGMLCWHSLLPSLNLLIHNLELKTAALQSYLSHPGQTAQSMDSLYEDLHWLVLLSAHILVSDVDSSPSVPQEFNELHTSSVTEEYLLANAEYIKTCGNVDVNPNQVDPIVRIITILLRLSKIYTVEVNQIHLLSPELASSMLWCFRFVTSAYLCDKEKQKNDMNKFHASLFADRSQTSQILCHMLSDIAIDWFSRWSAEPQVVQDAAQLLLKLAYGKIRASEIIKNQKTWVLANQISQQGHGVLLIPPKAQRFFVTALTMLACHAEPAEIGDRLWHEFLTPVKERHHNLINAPNFSQIAQSEPVKRDLVKIIETIRGITRAVLTDNITKIFAATNHFLGNFTGILGIYRNCPDIVEMILELFNDVCSSQLFYLNQDETAVLYQHCFQLLKSYSSHRIGHRSRSSIDSEEDQHTDLLLLIRLLTQLLSNEWFGSDESLKVVVEPGQPPIDVADIVLYGLREVIPLMTTDLLKFPSLSSEFFKLVTFVCQYTPERISSLPNDLYIALMTAISMALTEFGSDIAKVGLDSLAAMASYYFKNIASQHRQEQPFSDTLKHFLKVVFQLLLADNFDMDLVQIASETFFFLIYCHHDYYTALANELLSFQTEAVIHDRVKEAFQGLLPSTEDVLKLHKTTIVTFGERLEKFLLEVKGVLCFR